MSRTKRLYSRAERARQEAAVVQQLDELSVSNPARFDEMIRLLAVIVAGVGGEQKRSAARDRHIATITKTMDRALASPHAAEVARNVASTIATLGTNCDEYEGDDWSPASLKAIVICKAFNAPTKTLRIMAAQAKREFAWVEWWDREGEAKAREKPAAEST